MKKHFAGMAGLLRFTDKGGFLRFAGTAGFLRYAGTVGFLLFVVMLALSSCRKEEDLREIGVEGYVYLPQESGTYAGLEEIVGINGGNFCVSGDSLYFSWKEYAGGMIHIIRVDLSGEAGSLSPVEVARARGVCSYTVGPEGRVYYLIQKGNGKFLLYSVDRDGNTILKGKQIKGGSFPGNTDERSILNCLAVDGTGTIYLACTDTVYLFDPEGNPSGGISLEEYVENGEQPAKCLMKDGDGTVYCVVGAYRRTVVELHPGTEREAVPVEAWGGMDYTLPLFMTREGLFASGSDGTLYAWDLEDGKLVQEPVLRWQDSNLYAGGIRDLAYLPGGALLVKCSEEQAVVLYRTAEGEAPKKETLVLVSILTSSNSKLDEAVISFNKQSDKYRVVVERFGSDSKRPEAGEAAVTRLDASLAASNPPDLLDLSTLDIWKYASKGVLADLEEMLGEGFVEAYLENLREDLTIDGRLVCIPREFYLHTVVGRKDPQDQAADAGMLAGGYGSDDLLAVSKEACTGGVSYCTAVGGRDRSYFLGTFFPREYLDRYTDPQNGSSHFQDKGFGELLEWLKAVPNEESWDFHDHGYVLGDVLLEDQTIDSFTDMLFLQERFGAEPVLVGFPTADGMVRHIAEPVDAIGIVDASLHKEGAREFLEYYLTLGLKESYSYDTFPTRLKMLEEMAQDSSQPVYVNESGGLGYTPSEDHPNPHIKGYYNVGPNSFSYYYVEENLVETLMDALLEADFAPYSDSEKQVMDIVQEESVLYFRNQKSLEETLEIIDNRVTVLLQEGM